MNWRETILLSPLGAEWAAMGTVAKPKEEALYNMHRAKRRIEAAWNRGNLDQKQLEKTFTDPTDFLIFVTSRYASEELIFRQRTAAEAIKSFPTTPNPDGSQNFPLGLTINRLPKPLKFDLSTNDGPMLVVATDSQDQHQFTQTLIDSATAANPGIKIHQYGPEYNFKRQKTLSLLSSQAIATRTTGIRRQVEPIQPQDHQIVIASGLTREYMTDLAYIAATRPPHIHLVISTVTDDLNRLHQIIGGYNQSSRAASSDKLDRVAFPDFTRKFIVHQPYLEAQGINYWQLKN